MSQWKIEIETLQKKIRSKDIATAIIYDISLDKYICTDHLSAYDIFNSKAVSRNIEPKVGLINIGNVDKAVFEIRYKAALNIARSIKVQNDVDKGLSGHLVLILDNAKSIFESKEKEKEYSAWLIHKQGEDARRRVQLERELEVTRNAQRMADQEARHRAQLQRELEDVRRAKRIAEEEIARIRADSNSSTFTKKYSTNDYKASSTNLLKLVAQPVFKLLKGYSHEKLIILSGILVFLSLIIVSTVLLVIYYKKYMNKNEFVQHQIGIDSRYEKIISEKLDEVFVKCNNGSPIEWRYSIYNDKLYKFGNLYWKIVANEIPPIDKHYHGYQFQGTVHLIPASKTSSVPIAFSYYDNKESRWTDKSEALYDMGDKCSKIPCVMTVIVKGDQVILSSDYRTPKTKCNSSETPDNPIPEDYMTNDQLADYKINDINILLSEFVISKKCDQKYYIFESEEYSNDEDTKHDETNNLDNKKICLILATNLNCFLNPDKDNTISTRREFNCNLDQIQQSCYTKNEWKDVDKNKDNFNYEYEEKISIKGFVSFVEDKWVIDNEQYLDYNNDEQNSYYRLIIGKSTQFDCNTVKKKYYIEFFNNGGVQAPVLF